MQRRGRGRTGIEVGPGFSGGSVKPFREEVEPLGGLREMRVTAQPDGAIERLDRGGAAHGLGSTGGRKPGHPGQLRNPEARATQAQADQGRCGAMGRVRLPTAERSP